MIECTNKANKYSFISLTFVSLFILLVAMAGCNQENISGAKSKTHEKEIPKPEGNFISQELATYAAEELANNYNFKVDRLTKGKKVKRKTTKKTVKEVLALNKKDQKTALYLISYADGGFAVVSADKRTPAILAHSNNKTMPTTKESSIPGGLSWWLEQSISSVQEVRKSKSKKVNSYGAGWDNLLGIDRKLRPPPDECEDKHYSNGPLLETSWGQGVGYNNDSPHKSCSIPSNGKAWAGCVATAMAQVLNYHEFPNSYNWSNMPNNYGNDAISTLMFDVGEAVDMSRKCSASGASENNIVPALENNFHYSFSAEKMDYLGNTDVVRRNIENDRPVILTGYNKDYFIGLFPKRGSGHAWVADGYREDFYCDTGASYLSLHMTWGWDGSYNGWFSFNDLTPNDHDFNYKSAAIVGIHP